MFRAAKDQQCFHNALSNLGASRESGRVNWDWSRGRNNYFELDQVIISTFAMSWNASKATHQIMVNNCMGPL